jgi:hypothetical protein
MTIVKTNNASTANLKYTELKGLPKVLSLSLESESNINRHTQLIQDKSYSVNNAPKRPNTPSNLSQQPRDAIEKKERTNVNFIQFEGDNLLLSV